MTHPTIAELQHRARFRVGDEVHFQGHLRWRVVRRYYNKAQRTILYDLLYERTGMPVFRIRESDLVTVH